MIHLLKSFELLFNAENSDSSCRLAAEEVFDVLRNHRRRLVISYMAEEREAVSLRELSDHIAEIEGSDRQTVYISLYQQHFDRLKDVGAIKGETRRITPGPECETLYQIHEETARLLD